MKKLAILLITVLTLTSCGNQVEADPVDKLADTWQETCQKFPDSDSCHSAADNVRDQGSIYGYEIGGSEFRVTSSDSISDKCAVEVPPDDDDCNGEWLAHNNLGLYGMYCQNDTGFGSICYSKMIIRNITSSVLNLRLRATLYDQDGNAFEPNVSGESSVNYIPLNFETEFAKKLNPGQAEYWDVAFNVSGQLTGYTNIYLSRVGPSGGESLRLIPTKSDDSGFQYYEEAWYTNVKYTRNESTQWQPVFSRANSLRK